MTQSEVLSLPMAGERMTHERASQGNRKTQKPSAKSALRKKDDQLWKV